MMMMMMMMLPCVDEGLSLVLSNDFIRRIENCHVRGSGSHGCVASCTAHVSSMAAVISMAEIHP